MRMGIYLFKMAVVLNITNCALHCLRLLQQNFKSNDTILQNRIVIIAGKLVFIALAKTEAELSLVKHVPCLFKV